MICEYCGKEHDGSYGSGRFCSEKCSRGYSSSTNKGKIKFVQCQICHKNLTVPINVQKINYLCDDCKGVVYKEITLNNSRNQLGTDHIIKIKRVNVTCKVCGRTHLKRYHCDNEFCQHHSIQQFSSLIKYFGFDKSKLGTQDVEQEFNRIRNILYDLYWNKHLSSTEICKQFNYPNVSNLIDKIFTYLNIPHKTLSEAIKESFLMNRSIPPSSNRYNDTWHTTWDNKEVYLRSSYEEDYANKLDKQHIKYEVESIRIKYLNSITNKYSCAIPDFYLPDTNTIVEIKSFYTVGGKNGLINLHDKFKRYKELNYNCKFILEHKEYNSLEELSNEDLQIIYNKNK